MRKILLYTTLAFASASVMSGIFANQLISLEDINPTRVTEARWILIVISPVILMVNFIWLRSTPAKGKIDAFLQIFGQAVLFLAPYYWVFNAA